jgi:hypothetical protein
MRRALVMAAVVALGAALPQPAVADDKKAAAERFFRAGERAYNAGQYFAAAQAFEEAYELLPAPAIAFSAAQAYRLQYFIDKKPQRLKRAVELYRRYLEQQKSGGRVPDAARSLAELEPLLTAMERDGRMSGTAAEMSTTRLMVVSQVDGARGSIDGDEGGVLPLIKEVSPGDHTIAVEADGYFPVSIKAKAVRSELVPIEVDLQPRPALLDIEAESGARIAVDGRFAGTAPLRGLELAAGTHYLAVTRRGRRPAGQEIAIARGERRRVSVDLRSTTQRKAAWWVLGASAALAVGAGVTGTVALLADGDAAEIDDRRRTTTLTEAEADRYDQLRARRDDGVQATWILGGAAVAIGIAGALMFVFDDPRAEAPAMSVEPSRPAAPPPVVRPMATIGAGGGVAGIQVGGSF